MACYYLVISSTHLSNGHFRSIKGVFRGPLHKTGASLPGYAEKGKSIANALEDLKANFYCELCDKQYHKHQEFDNHINSYDHAHKQRLKELKQREFARNVASKSWKDEKKQEKALKRLHELAELRKQTHCVADDGPFFKAPRFKVPQEDATARKDDRTASSKCTITSIRDTIISNVEEPKQSVSSSLDVLKNSNCCNTESQTQQSPLNSSSVNNRAGVSFCFSRKALLKLDSSASVFNESTEEANECGQFLHYKEKQMSVSFRHYAHISETVAENSTSSQQDETHIPLPDSMSENAEKCTDDKGSQENTKEQREIAQSTVEMQSQGTTCADQQSPREANVTLETELTSEVSDEVCCQAESFENETCSSKHTVADAILIEHLSNLLSQKNGEVEANCNVNEANSTASNDAVQNSSECPEHSLGESLNTNTQAKPLSFLSVLSKDGNTILQWPTELLLFTKTQPSISYACNPLYFDFKCSQKHKTGKSNEQITKGQKQNQFSKTDCDERTSGSNKEKAIKTQFPKREKDSLENRVDQKIESPKKCGQTAHKAKSDHLQEYSTQVCTNFSSLQNCTRKRRTLQSEKIKMSGYSSVQKDTSSEEEPKRKRFVHKDQHDKWHSMDKSKRRKRTYHFGNKDGWESSNCSKDSDSDTSSSISTKSSFSQMSSASSSTSNGLNCRTHDITLERVSFVSGKHNNNSLESDHNSEVRREPKCVCKNEKHNMFNEIPRYENVEHHTCSMHANSGQLPPKTPDDFKTSLRMDRSHSAQEVHNKSSKSVDSRIKISSASPEETVPSSPSLRRSHKESHKSDSLNESHFPIIPFSRNHGDDITQDKVQHTALRRKLISQFFSEDGPCTKQIKENDLGIKNHQNHFDTSFTPADPIEIALPLHDTIITGTPNGEEMLENNTESNSSENNFSLTTDSYSFPMEGVDPLNTEFKVEVPVMEPLGQLNSQIQHFKQNPSPVQLNFALGMPYLRHPGGSELPNTKEEQRQMQHPNLNKRLGPMDGSLRCCYNSTMQDFQKMDNNRRLYHKSSPPAPPPPPTQQPVTFSSDEVDKYKLLQMQAQQHMQKQLLTKHFKALPANGSPVLSNAQTVQPVSVHHHPSIAIHHTFMQRYAVTASMHSHISHFSLPHLNPLPQSQFAPLNISSLTPALFQTSPPLIAGHPLPHALHLIPAANIHPAHLTIQAIPHATLIPTLIAPHPNAGIPPTLQLHPLIHPLFQGQDIHHHSGPGHPH
ncbi:zinc finger protein 804B [Gastrophryne carolinensis]